MFSGNAAGPRLERPHAWVKGIALMLAVTDLGLTPAAAQAGLDQQIAATVAALAAPVATRERIDSLGIAVSSHGQRAYYSFSGTGSTGAGQDDVVEIGSVTKVLTTLLYAQALAEGRMRETDPIQKYLPSVRLGRCTAAITLTQLADFSSGLPRVPGNVPPALAGQSISNYTAADLRSWLASLPSPRSDCGLPAPYLYSNVSVGLLGDILATVYGTTWDSLVSERIARPLGMGSTAVEPGGARRLQGYGIQGRPARSWPRSAWYAAGALRSTPDDMLSFGEAALGHRVVAGRPVPPALTAAFTRTMTPIYRPAGKSFRQAMAWTVTSDGGDTVANKDGETNGFNSMIVIDRTKDLAVFVVANRANSGVPALAMAIARALP